MIARWIPFAAVAALLAATGTAAAQPATAEKPAPAPPRNALSLSLASLSARSLAVEYERALPWPRLSVAFGLGARDSADGDYEAMTVGAGAEGRYWLTGRAALTRMRGAMVGPYLGLRADISQTTTEDAVAGRTIGRTVTFAGSGSFGYRLAIASRIEVTPSVGIAVRTEVDADGRMAPWTRAALTFGLTCGALF